MEVRITITDQSVKTEHEATVAQDTTASGQMAQALSGQTGAAAAMASGAINAGPAPTALAATGTGVPEAFIAAVGGLSAATAGGAESAGPAPNL
jgi:hypothetical protein